MSSSCSADAAPGSGIPESREAVDVSVVIPAYRGAATIAACLAAVERSARGRRCEIIVVESSGDGTVEVVRAEFPDVVLIESARRLSAGAARNRGLEAAVGRFVLCVDQDCIVPPDWVERMVNHLETPGVGAAGGSVGIANPSSLSGSVVYFMEFLTHFPARRPPQRNSNFLIGCNSGFRRETLATLRFPDQTLGEDVLLSQAVRRFGHDTLYDPALEVRHHNRRGWRECLRYNFVMGTAAAARHAQHRHRWVNPFIAYPILAFASPAVILPLVAWRLRWRPSYLARFLLLAPACLLGNLVWAAGFRKYVIQSGLSRGSRGIALARKANEKLSAGDGAAAESLFREALQRNPGLPAWVHAGLGFALLDLERLEEATQAFQECVRLFPEAPPGHVGLARVMQQREDFPRALAAWDRVIERFPEEMPAHASRAQVLTSMGRFAEAEAACRLAVTRWPEAAFPMKCLARLAAQRRDYAAAAALWRELSKRFPHDLSIRADLVSGLLNALRPEEAREAFEAVEEGRRTPRYRALEADIHAAAYDWPAAIATLDELGASAPENVDLRVKQAITRRNLARFLGEPVHVRHAIDVCEDLMSRRPASLTARLTLAECLIAACRDDEAAAVIDRIPAGFDTRRDVLEMRAWRSRHAGDLPQAKRIWQDILDRHHERAVHGPDEPFEHLDGRSLEPGPGEILLFTVVRNQAWRLPWFVRWYRDLGVDRFYFVDNGSDDGGTDYLLQQPDVHVLRTEGSYAKAESGMRWVNQLVERFGADHWCLYVDADEMLVFPGMEEVGLRHLLDAMNDRGEEAVCAFMLDMHGPTVLYRPDCRPGEDLLQLYPWFENAYSLAGAVRCPYRQMSGGMQRFFRSSWNLTKTPVIRGGRSIRFLSSSHEVTPAAVSTVTGALLHFKVAGELSQWDQRGIGDRMPLCTRRHLQYARELAALDADVSLIGPATVRYETSRQLIELGLIACPAGFLATTAAPGERR